MTARWLIALPTVIALRALRVRLSVGPWRRHWNARARHGDLLLVALGDSLTQGIGSSRPSRSWLGRYAAELSRTCGRSIRVDNRAVYGARIADVLATQLPVADEAAFVTLCVGSNDAGRTDPQTFRDALRSVCAQLPRGSVVGDVPEFQWGGRVEAAAELSQITRDVVAEFDGLRLASVQAHTAGAKIFTELAGDFFHPGDRIYGRIADAFLSAPALRTDPV